MLRGSFIKDKALFMDNELLYRLERAFAQTYNAASFGLARPGVNVLNIAIDLFCLIVGMAGWFEDIVEDYGIRG